MSPFLIRYAWHYPDALDVERLAKEGLALVGERDFTAFTVAVRGEDVYVEDDGVAVAREGAVPKLLFRGDGSLCFEVERRGRRWSDRPRATEAGSISERIEAVIARWREPPPGARVDADGKSST